MGIEDLRDEIDEIDSEIALLISRRTKVAKKIAKEKRKLDKQPIDKKREKEVIDHWLKIAREEGMTEEGIARIAKQLIRFTRKEENKKKS